MGVGSSTTRLLVRGLLACGLLALVVFPGTGARAASSYSATADARLVAVDFTTTPAILFDPLFDGGASVAQAQIDSLGGTSAFAADPYPGGTALGLPGLLASNGVPTSGVPEYPLVVSSHQAKPSDHREAGTVSLDAQSLPGSSSGRVIDGATSARATATADPDTDDVRALAEATISSLQLSSTLTLHGVRSLAEVTRNGAGAIQRSSSFEVSSLTILGQRVAMTRNGLSLLGTDVPLGASPNALLAPLLESLAGDGTTLEFLPATESPEGVTSAGLRITSVQAAPPEVASGLESFTTQVTLGRVSAFVSNAAFGSDDTDVELAAPGADVSGQPLPSTLDATEGSAVEATTAIDAPVRSPRPAEVAAGRTSALIANVSLGRFYPVLIFAGAVAIAVVNVIRHLGVRKP